MFQSNSYIRREKKKRSRYWFSFGHAHNGYPVSLDHEVLCIHFLVKSYTCKIQIMDTTTVLDV